jgi:hypothetical protein
MVKQGDERSSKFSVKHDPLVIMYRLKSLQNMAHLNFVDAALQHQLVDENLAAWLTEANLKYGQRSVLYDFIRKVVWKWVTMSDITKDILHDQWLDKGLPESLWLKIEAKYSEVTTFHSTYNSRNIMVTFETDVFPYPEQNVNPVETDYVQPNEVLPIPTEDYVQHFWRQKTVKYGSVNYICYWYDALMDKYPTVLTIIETVEPLLYDKSVSIFAHLTEPYQSPLDKFPFLETSYDILESIIPYTTKNVQLQTSERNTSQEGLSKTPNINISYTTEVT